MNGQDKCEVVSACVRLDDWLGRTVPFDRAKDCGITRVARFGKFKFLQEIPDAPISVLFGALLTASKSASFPMAALLGLLNPYTFRRTGILYQKFTSANGGEFGSPERGGEIFARLTWRRLLWYTTLVFRQGVFRWDGRAVR